MTDTSVYPKVAHFIHLSSPILSSEQVKIGTSNLEHRVLIASLCLYDYVIKYPKIGMVMVMFETFLSPRLRPTSENIA